MSPYSVKVRSYFRYKGIPHQWILRNAASQAEYEKHAKMPIIPLVVTPDGTGVQDSTPIIDQLEKLHPEPSIHPADPVARFISALIEEFGDEWGNKWMFHYRWARDVDRSDCRRPDRRRCAPRARLGASHAVAESRRRVRNLDIAGADPDADPGQTGRKAVLAVDTRQRDRAPGRQGRVQRHARRQG